MKNIRKKAYLLCLIYMITTLLTGCQSLFPVGTENTAGTESSSGTENTAGTESSTETEPITETTETDISSEDVITKPLTYIEKCELDYVEPPVKRTREEAVEKIKELSRWFPGLYLVYQNEELYPEPLLIAAAGNPEMTDFMVGFLTTDGSVDGHFTEDEQPEDFPLILQWDPRWGYMTYGTLGNMGSSGCGPTCLSMAVFYLTGNRDCTPDQVANYSMDNGYYVKNVGTAWSLIDDYPKEYGLSVSHPSLSEEKFKAELDKGNILICSVRPGDFTSGGHFIVIYGYDENGFKVNDPKCIYRSRLSWTFEQIEDDIKYTWSVGK